LFFATPLLSSGVAKNFNRETSCLFIFPLRVKKKPPALRVVVYSSRQTINLQHFPQMLQAFLLTQQ